MARGSVQKKEASVTSARLSYGPAFARAVKYDYRPELEALAGCDCPLALGMLT
jgi:hypothetical protein